ncbi:hypothetical protein [Oceanobacillus senegalensis]|uniref:hypothetical protein n=1 Tax=Oceanobacillus senegalensis TaxID=1936063 RepID=UPI000A3103D7|nr:hypothetical protein [Oceanobacillus senegalensis]
MKKIFVKACNWLAFILFILCIISVLFDITVYHSNYIVFYGISVLGLIIGLMSWLFRRFNPMKSVTKIVGYIGFYGNFAVVILFFPPIFAIWGTFLFGP